MEDVAPATTRRGLLASVGAVGASSLAGCSERLWWRAENVGPDQIELTIKTVPTDDDIAAATIMSRLRENFRDAGIAVTHEPVPEPGIYRDVLLEGDYDVFVLRHPGLDGYDALRGLLHSDFVNESGWQNPFHFSNLTVDDLLEEQRRTTGHDRREPIVELLEFLCQTVPYTTVAFPTRIGGRHERIDVERPPFRALDYLDLVTRESADDSRNGPLEVGVFGGDLADRLNPLAVGHSGIDGLIGLLYDPLVRRGTRDTLESGNEYGTAEIPWLAEQIEWNDSADQLRADISLREGLEWHDGVDLDANDVVFTFRLLRDTSRGEIEDGLPAPRYRSRQTVAETVDAVDSRTVRFSFGETAREVARRALSLPILPEHVWGPRTDVVANYRTEALATDNEDPVGSGLFQLESVAMDEVVLEPFSDHVFREETTDRPDVIEAASQLPEIRFQLAPNAGSMIESLLEGDIDVTGDGIPPGNASSVTGHEDVSAITASTNSFYMIGYNHHHSELGNPRFRLLLSQLIDRSHVVSEVFDGFAEPAISPGSLLGIADGEFAADAEMPVLEFPGSNGEIDDELVRSLFQDAGYRYEDGALLG
ncbi:ABC transporter substrate-binding protein [Natronobacterium gregoryi]|uniref:ABC transporter periplasmic protein n=2 Tax=Natronobacterium gregoryi TaxID=44930 RepID=L0ABK8_NATGS|nr:ABC transporter substrate-binding protein [Natronobacterium gregoryi]AFZ71283.1 extracellular solute-binding protein, family 5 [Natronobacterium gregoryi SP2]ELY67215.1 ABC transporter periplasmic protein [Natronobacterium gregoryi SP2]PLK19866.1 ABC transporter substrate-binding protein [Natronobacterium gregoryi SP2]SFJ39455.1 peptide/nickel transport system substrate-binding protein [Natronobacterium gregoryi]